MSRWVASASRWLRRKPATPRPVGPSATRTSGRSASAAGTAPRSGPSAPATQTHSAEALGDDGERPRARRRGRPPRRPARARPGRRRAGRSTRSPRCARGRARSPAAPTRARRDRRALEDQRDDLEALGVGAAGELVALALDLLGDAGERLVDEGEDRARGDVEQLAQLAGSDGQLEGQRHPAPPGDVLADAVAVQRVGVEAAPHEVAGDGEGLRPEVRRDPRARGRGRWPSAQWTRLARLLRRTPAASTGSVGDRVLGIGEDRRVDLGEDLLGRLEQQRSAPVRMSSATRGRGRLPGIHAAS